MTILLKILSFAFILSLKSQSYVFLKEEKNNNSKFQILSEIYLLEKINNKDFFKKHENKFKESFKEDYKKYENNKKKGIEEFYQTSFKKEKDYFNQPGLYQYKITNIKNDFIGYISYTIYKELPKYENNIKYKLHSQTYNLANLKNSKDINFCYVQLFFICDKWKRKGIGSSALKTVFNKVKNDLNIKIGLLDVRDVNKRGINFYLKNGAIPFKGKTNNKKTRIWKDLDENHYNNGLVFNL